METISTHSHNLVIDADTRLPIFSDDGQCVLLNRLGDDSLQYYTLEEVEKVFGRIQTVESAVRTSSSSGALVHKIPSSSSSVQTVERAVLVHPRASTSSDAQIHNIDEFEDNIHDTPSTSKNTEERFRITWAQQDILKLINIYKDHASLFKSQAIRHEKIWKMIADKMPVFTVEQVKNKFKYLKARYIKKIENMSDKASGQDKFIFDYFEEFNSLFGKDPNIKPLSVASSLKEKKRNEEDSQDLRNEKKRRYLTEIQETKNIPSTENIQPGHSETSKKENKLTTKIEKMTKVLIDLRQDLNNREKERERRHAENYKSKQEATDAFKDYLKFLREKEEKK